MMDFWGVFGRFFSDFFFQDGNFLQERAIYKTYVIVCENFKNFAKICFVLRCSIKCINLTTLDQIWRGPLDFRLRPISTWGIKFIDKFTQNSSRKKFDCSSFSPYPLKVYQIFLSIELFSCLMLNKSILRLTLIAVCVKILQRWPKLRCFLVNTKMIENYLLNKKF